MVEHGVPASEASTVVVRSQAVKGVAGAWHGHMSHISVTQVGRQLAWLTGSRVHAHSGILPAVILPAVSV